MTYWVYRIDKRKIDFFRDELKQGRLRQGWGHKLGQDLRNLEHNNEGASGNLRMLYVEKGDILLVPYLSGWGTVAIVEATEDWDKGYKFEISKHGDYGHIFPAKYLKSFVRGNKYVTGSLRKRLEYKRRFRCIYLDEDIKNIKQLMEMKEEELDTCQEPRDRFKNAINKTFFEGFEKEFKNKIYNELNTQLDSHDWEHALVEGLGKLFPYYDVEHVGGHNEQNHGTDILIRIPSLLNREYGIAIQVKDWGGVAGNDPIKQIKKADKYWEKDNNLKLIEKIVIITGAKKEENLKLLNERDDVEIIFAKELTDILGSIAKRLLVEDDTF